MQKSVIGIIAVLAIITMLSLGLLYVNEVNSIKTVTQTVTQNSTSFVPVIVTRTETQYQTQTIVQNNVITSYVTSYPTHNIVTVSVNSQIQVTMNETLVNGTTYVIYVMLYTTKGNMELELFPQSAPKSVANFVNLASVVSIKVV